MRASDTRTHLVQIALYQSEAIQKKKLPHWTRAKLQAAEVHEIAFHAKALAADELLEYTIIGRISKFFTFTHYVW